MKRKNVMIIDPSAIVIEGIKNIVETSPEFKITKTHSSNIDSSIAVLSNIDIVLVNPRMCTESHINKFIQDCKAANSNISILAIQTTYLPTKLIHLFDGVIEMDDEPAVIFSKLRIRKAKENEYESNENCDLSTREKEVLVLVAKGKTNKEIADQLNISIHTVIAHRKNITGKTNIKSISGLTIYALLNNLISQDEIF